MAKLPEGVGYDHLGVEPIDVVYPKPRKRHAYGLPAGSIRAILALMTFFGIWVLLLTKPHVEVPTYLQNLMFIIMGHYFATRAKLPVDTSEPQPLWLPKGTIRAMLLLGFVFVGYMLFKKNQLWINGELSKSAVSLILVLGFMLGVVRSMIFKKHRLWLENVRATVSLAAGVLLILIICDYAAVPASFQSLPIRFRYEEVLAGVVGFYFGSKS